MNCKTKDPDKLPNNDLQYKRPAVARSKDEQGNNCPALKKITARLFLWLQIPVTFFLSSRTISPVLFFS